MSPSGPSADYMNSTTGHFMLVKNRHDPTTEGGSCELNVYANLPGVAALLGPKYIESGTMCMFGAWLYVSQNLTLYAMMDHVALGFR